MGGGVLTQRELLVAPVFPALAADPEAASSTNKGAVYFNTATGKLRYSDGTSWVEAGSAAAGASNLFISAGTDAESLSKVLGTLGAQSLGSEGDSLAISASLATLPVGSDGASLAVPTVIGSGARSIGTDAEAMTMTELATVPVGGDGASLSASATVVGTKYAGTATAVSNGGTVDWVSPSSATGAFDDVTASITASAASAVMNDDLKLTGFSIPPILSGFTRTKVEVLARHRWDSTGQPLETCSFVVTLRKADNTLVATVKTITQATASQATLLTETFDVTAACAALTDAELQGLQVWCEADCTLLAVAQGNFSWNVDGVHIRPTYTKSGIA